MLFWFLQWYNRYQNILTVRLKVVIFIIFYVVGGKTVFPVPCLWNTFCLPQCHWKSTLQKIWYGHSPKTKSVISLGEWKSLWYFFFSIKVLEYSISTPKLLPVKVQLSHKRYSNYYLVIKTSCSIAPLISTYAFLEANISNLNLLHL